jgi:dihydroflavonol-4-reductase
MIAHAVGVSPPRIPTPLALARWGSKLGEWIFTTLLHKPFPAPSFFVEMIAQFQHYDCSKAIRDLGLHQSPVENAIRDAVKWLRENAYLK